MAKSDEVLSKSALFHDMKAENEIIRHTFNEIMECLLRLVDVSVVRPSLEAHHFHYKPNLHDNEHKVNVAISPPKRT